MCRILTWNTAGYSLWSIKRKIREAKLPQYVCLQESSDLMSPRSSIINRNTLANDVNTGIMYIDSKDRSSEFYYVANWKSSGHNNRCSLAIMVKLENQHEVEMYRGMTKVLHPGKSFEKCRPMLCIDDYRTSQISIGCVHIVSRSSGPSTRGHVLSILRANPGFNNYIIAGDFNCIPEKLKINKEIYSPNKPTRKDKIYDYFITDNANMFYVNGITVMSSDLQSDHHPVYMQYSKQG